MRLVLPSRPGRALVLSLLSAAPIAAPLSAQTAELEIMVHDTDSIDWIALRLVGECGPVTGVLAIDFGPSAGGVVIDTEYGGRGSQDPMSVGVLFGPIALGQVPDGATALEIAVAGLEGGDQAVVTLDLDTEQGATAADRIVARPWDIAGSRAIFAPQNAGDGLPATATFDANGYARLPLPVPCIPPALS
ncbi:hypothetical protein N8I71_13760 [Roseibacterium sp. SDUM158016]|uniref:hypothetical protein n=1 Tax=Roseicyclus sediminis TaxID=2980997 RepID=UPI0021CE14A2|nr:hypothetical protein [Roseibacterium sp. SDUM158016]MCU4653906.1 hypothetical protein [Roseibacterium sp. SDUM158016]